MGRLGKVKRPRTDAELKADKVRKEKVRSPKNVEARKAGTARQRAIMQRVQPKGPKGPDITVAREPVKVPKKGFTGSEFNKLFKKNPARASRAIAGNPNAVASFKAFRGGGGGGPAGTPRLSMGTGNPIKRK